MEEVRKAVIPAAGFGTRFLPATKAQPKEMLPIIDKPTIHFVIEEVLNSGIDDIIIVTGRGKRAIEDYFDKNIELENHLESSGKKELLKEIQELSDLANVHYVRQKEQKGLGHAILCAKKHIGKEPFAVLLGDTIVQNCEPCTQQLIKAYEELGGSTIAVEEVPKANIPNYGIISGKRDGMLLT
jgi:UTP--glucose-1-phosphate uridylyltransferase